MIAEKLKAIASRMEPKENPEDLGEVEAEEDVLDEEPPVL
jgi:hypothetical protein